MSVARFHNSAMDAMELAQVNRVQGKMELYKKWLQSALRLEWKAVKAMEKAGIQEPTYSILCRSAISIAIESDKLRLAKQMIIHALLNISGVTKEFSPLWNKIREAEKVGCKCQECRRTYKVDLDIPDRIRKKITSDKADLLCGPCIMIKIENLNRHDHFRLIGGTKYEE